MQTEMRKPDVIFIGNLKSGSTFMRSYFKQHDQIHFERQLWYLQVEDDDDVRRKTYLNYFQGVPTEKVFIDVYELMTMAYVLKKTPQMDYSSMRAPDFWDGNLLLNPEIPNNGSVILPGHEEIIRRIQTIMPDVRVMLGLRNQIDWMLSAYINYLYILPGDHSFMTFMKTLDGKAAYLAGFHDRTIEMYERAFGRENMFIFLLEELANQDEETLRNLCQFLGVDYQPIDHTKSNRLTTPDHSKQIAAQYNAPQSKSPRLPFQGPLAFLNRFAFNKHGEQLQANVFSDDIIQMIHSSYAFSNYRAMQMTGKDLIKYGYPL
jgi:hypothetical protein